MDNTNNNRKGPLANSSSLPPFPTKDIRDDWQMPGDSGPRTKARAKAMRKPPFKGNQG